jgi:hypothetical protein
MRIVQNPQQEVGMHNKENPITRQRHFRFEDEELWMMLPEAVRERCRTLWKQLLGSVLNVDERRTDERED